MPNFPPARLAWLIWGLGAALYLIGFFQRVAPAVMSGELMQEFGIGAAVLGNVSALYFYSYVAMQVPTGVLADRWGPRRLLTAGALVAGLGGLLFALAPTLWLVGAGRLLVGASVAVAFVGMMKLAGHWMAPRQFAFATGMALLIGVTGGLSAGLPLARLIGLFGWRPVMAVAAVLSLGLAAATWLLVRDDPTERGYRSHAGPADAHAAEGFFSGLGKALRYRNVTLVSLAGGALGGPVLSFAGLWGVPFLSTHYGMSMATAASYCSGMLVAFALAGPVLGGLTDRLGRRKPLFLFALSLALLGWLCIVLVPALPPALLLAAMLAAGFGGGAMIIGFAYAKESVPPPLAGTAAGLVNMGVMLGPMLLQPAIGWILDARWQGGVVDGLRVYGLEAYQSGFALMLAWLALGLAAVALTRETHCRTLAEREAEEGSEQGLPLRSRY